MLTPWTVSWERNYFAALWPWLAVAMHNNFVRGAVTGIGVVTGWVGLRELTGALMSRWSARE